MEDAALVELYWQRAPEAIGHTQEKYGAYCLAIAGRLVPVREDAEECVNDTWLRAWNAMPTARPCFLAPFLGRITRNLALDKAAFESAQKRGGGHRVLQHGLVHFANGAKQCFCPHTSTPCCCK